VVINDRQPTAADLRRRRVLIYLYSTKNIAGCVLALVGLGLFFTGIIGSFIWPFVVAGMYAIGALVAPGSSSYNLTSTSFDPNDVRQALGKQMNAIHGKVPPEIEAKVQSINDTILGILPHYGEFPAGSPDLFVVGRTATDYLPRALQSYLNLPRVYASTHPVDGSKTSQQVLSDQLDLLGSKMNDVADAVHKKDSDALLANGRFLEDKFGKSQLSIPASS
jgi:hypothetical protein